MIYVLIEKVYDSNDDEGNLTKTNAVFAYDDLTEAKARFDQLEKLHTNRSYELWSTSQGTCKQLKKVQKTVFVWSE